MATQHQVEVQDKFEEQPEIRAEQLLRIMVEAQGPEFRIVPWLVGPTGSGKTARVEVLAQELGLPMEVVLLGTAMPEDILGLPSVGRDRDGVRVTHWTLSKAMRRATVEPVVLFLDEVDKAGADQVAQVLTMIQSRVVRGVQLHPGTKIVLASQPVDAGLFGDETWAALLERALFIPISPSKSFLARVTSQAWANALPLRQAEFGHKDLPVPSVLSMRRGEYLYRLGLLLMEQGFEKADVVWAFLGATVKPVAKALADALFSEAAVSLARLRPEQLAKVPAEVVLGQAADILAASPWRAAVAFEAVARSVDSDKWSEFTALLESQSKHWDVETTEGEGLACAFVLGSNLEFALRAGVGPWCEHQVKRVEEQNKTTDRVVVVECDHDIVTEKASGDLDGFLDYSRRVGEAMDYVGVLFIGLDGSPKEMSWDEFVAMAKRRRGQ